MQKLIKDSPREEDTSREDKIAWRQKGERLAIEWQHWPLTQDQLRGILVDIERRIALGPQFKHVVRVDSDEQRVEDVALLKKIWLSDARRLRDYLIGYLNEIA